jgi:lipoprotein NlpI
VALSTLGLIGSAVARLAALALVIAAATAVPARAHGAQTPQDLADRAEAAFAQGQFAASVAAFDELARLVPSAAPTLWQRGIALYFLGRYDECAAQFAAFAQLDPADLENASWRFLCVARAGSVDRARATLPSAGPDGRIMREQIYDLFRGRMTPAEVMAAAADLPIAQFYAHLYVGLYLELIGDQAGAKAHLAAAASDAYQPYGGFMNVVAHVHAAALAAR